MKNYYFFFILIAINIFQILPADSFKYNTLNNHGVIGLINTPTARFYPEASYGLTVYDGTPDQKITMTSFPYNWLEASFFYTNIQDKPYCGWSSDRACNQDYKDKGFNFRLRLKDEDAWPAIAIGISDIAGTGYYSSEYIVASYGINKVDLSLGLGWGVLNGASEKVKNPLTYLYDGFNDRPYDFEDNGGQFQPSRYFSGESASPFFGLSYALNKNIIFKFEYDATLTPGIVGYQNKKNEYSYAIEYIGNNKFNIGLSNERGTHTSLKFVLKSNPNSSKPKYKYRKAKFEDDDDKYTKLVKSIEANDIGVNKIIETKNEIGIELTQFSHPNLDIIEEIIKSASYDAGIDKPIKKGI